MTRFFLGNWATRVYLFAVAMTAVVLLGRNLATGDQEPTLAAAYLIGLTSPISIAFAPVFLIDDGWTAIAMLWLSVCAGTLLNTLIINLIVGRRAVAQGRQSARTPRPGFQPSARYSARPRVTYGSVAMSSTAVASSSTPSRTTPPVGGSWRPAETSSPRSARPSRNATCSSRAASTSLSGAR